MRGKATLNPENGTPCRHLAWEGCYNTRDLGGLPTLDGRETRWRAVIRSDILNRLTEAGQRALLDYGVKTVIDLRAAHEVAREPAVTIQDGDRRLDYFNLPIEKYYPHVGVLIQQAQSRAEVYGIILDHYPDAVAEIMRAIVGAQPGGIVIHCHAGKDRTGMVVALLLRLVGVPAEIIAADYAQSQERLWAFDEKVYAEMRAQGDTSFWWRPTVTEEVIYRVLEHVDTRYGGAEEYLRAAGVLPEELDQLKRRLLAR
ncbi:MAG: tyrosine-protein phosphatase [Anaerolineae bacterium]|nr:tyrosine-protein phosphatase [Anaerolineae bacterium]